MKNATKGFSLIELLVVITMIAALMAMLLPALEKARQSALQAACMSNMRHISLAVALYEDDYAESMPVQTGDPHWWPDTGGMTPHSGYDVPVDMPGNNPRTAWWCGKVYAYQPAPGIWTCRDWDSQYDWWFSEQITGKYTTVGDIMRDPVYGYDNWTSFTVCQPLVAGQEPWDANMPWPKKVSAFARPGEVFAYSHIGPANPYWTFSEQMYPVWWPGPHRKAGAPVVHDYVQDVEVVCGTNGFIFADGHVNFMSWMQTRCWLADHVDPVTKHLNVGFLSYAIGPSQCSAHAEANGLTTWCSCEPAAGQQ